MPAASLTFTLPEERIEHLHAVHGSEAFAAMHDLDQWLRGMLKHGGIAEWTAERLAEAVRSRLGESTCLIDG